MKGKARAAAGKRLSAMGPRRLLIGVAVLLVGVNVLSAVWDVRNMRGVVERKALRDFNNLSGLLVEQTARSLESVGLVLHTAAMDISVRGMGNLDEREARLKDRISGIPQIFTVLVLDRDGHVVVGTDPRTVRGADYSERTYFTSLRDGAAQARYVSGPFKGLLTGRWGFAVSEPYRDAKGDFAGVVAATIDVDYVDRLYRSLDLGERGFVSLLTDDGSFITRAPPKEELFGKRLQDADGVLASVKSNAHYAGWASGALDHQEEPVLLSAAPVPDSPLIVLIGSPQSAVLQPWRTEADRVTARTFLTSAVMLALMALAARELTRRERADERVRESEKRYALAVAGANDGIWDFDAVSNRLYQSARALELMGLDPKLEGFQRREEWEKMIRAHPEDAASLEQSISRHMAGDERYYHAEWRALQPDGTYRWIMVRGLCIRDEAGRPLRYAGSITDIEPRKRHEAEILRQTALLDELFESAPEAVAFSDRDMRIVRANRAFTSLFGFELEEIVGRRPEELVIPEDRHEEMLFIQERIRAGGRVSLECERVRKDGTRLRIALTASPVIIDGKIIGFYALYRDITEAKLAEAEQLRLQARLRQAEKMEAVGRLAGGIAHDFNNILGGILGYGEMLLESASADAPEQRYARNLLIAANRARDLVEQILTYSRSQRAARVPVDLARVVSETLDVIRGSLPQGVTLVPTLPVRSPVVIGDPTQLHQVVMNLCTNAIHSMGDGGTLCVSLEPVELEQELTLSQATLAPGRYVKLTVADTGTGMDGATLARIFEPFFTTKQVGRGTGLGLSLVYGIVADAGGATHVVSRLGHGSTFEIYLPRADIDDVAAEPGDAPVPRGNGERVLLVDDEKPLLIMTAELLARLGYDPAPFSDAGSALASLQAMPEAYDLVLTDEMMPGLTGTSLARAAHKARPSLPIILVSGYTGPALLHLALDAGVREVLKKPVQTRELAVALARALAA